MTTLDACRSAPLPPRVGRFQPGFHLLPIALAALGLLNSCSRKADNESHMPAVLARVGQTVIAPETFQRELERRARLEPGRYDSLEARRKLLEEMIHFEAMHQKALAGGYAEREEVRQKIKRLLVAKYEEEQLAALPPATVQPQEIESYYQQHGDIYGTPGRARVAIVRVDCPRTASAEQRAQLQARAGQARTEAVEDSGKSIGFGFGAVAQKYSDHQASRYRGGEVGWLELGGKSITWPAELLAAISQLPTAGAISPVVAAADGFYLVKLLERTEAGARPLEQVRPGIEHRLMREREQAREQTMRAAALKDLEVRINEAQLAAMVPSPAPQKLPPSLTGRPVAKVPNP